jgi:hypothetical protein
MGSKTGSSVCLHKQLKRGGKIIPFNLLKQDELEAELEDLEGEELEEELPEPPARTPAPVEPSARATSPSKQRSDLSELTKLQAEMAL